MKKTLALIATLAAGVSSAFAAAATDTTVDYTFTQDVSASPAVVTLADLNGQSFSSDNGFSLMFSTTDWTATNAPLFYLTGDSFLYNNSIVTFGYATAVDPDRAALFNSANGSAASNRVTYSDITGADLPSTKSTSIASTFCITVDGTQASLYELDSTSNEFKQICQATMAGGTVSKLVYGGWANADGTIRNTGNTASLNLDFYQGVLSVDQMNSIATPEPATATLSLLALAGLAARRRRK